jgi:primosomal replication protein N''
MTIYVRNCQGCKEERSEQEVFCGNCGWNLTQEALCLPGQLEKVHEIVLAVPTDKRHCTNGHPLDDGDEMCLDCGAFIAEEAIEENIQTNETIIDGWSVIERLESDSEIYEKYIVARHDYRAQLTYFCPDTHPDISIYEIIKRLPKDSVPELLAYGEWEGRRYEVTDVISQTGLLSLLSDSVDLKTIQQIVMSIGKILSLLASNGLRHGNIRPENILITNKETLSLLLTGFQYSCFSTYDLDTVRQPGSAHYTAPELIAGGISVASDWWSLGMLILQLITKGQCFEGINEKAFRIHIVTRGVTLPSALDPTLNTLLRGLLARDPDQRWQWAEVQRWLAGEEVDTPSDISLEVSNSGPIFEFNGYSYTCPKAYALSAAELANWDEAKDLFLRGVVATWLEDQKSDSKMLAGVRTVASIDSIPDDFKHALALMWLNPHLPLIIQGEIVTSAWLLQNAIQGYELISSPLIGQLRQMGRELHLCELHDRIERVREKAKLYEIEIDEGSFKVLVLVSSRFNLDRQWEIHRRAFPGSDHAGLNALMDRQKITDDELIILLAAALNQYQPAEQILKETTALAEQAGLTAFSESDVQQWFDKSRKELYREIENRTVNYSQCGILRIDEWANDFALQRRMSLSRALVLLSVPNESWTEPDRLEYVSRLLEFFEKRTVNMAKRGPLARMLISKSNPRIDLASISGNKPNASLILEHLINRTDVPIGIDRAAFENNTDLEKKLRHLVTHATTYRRDTGVDSLYLGFPFLIMRDNFSETVSKSPKIAPILLWPIKINIEARDRATILFDQDREEVRINPALSSIIGVDEVKIWMETVNELLGRASIRIEDVMDAFGALTDSVERNLCLLPNKDFKIDAMEKQVICSAVLFHAAFMGQSLSEDLRQMKKLTLTNTSLETILRVSNDPIISSPLPLIPEKDRYFTVESDPSQEKAVFCARQAPGLLIEGPPGTGKSQTIVNIIGDCIGRNESVLIVCQKAAALEVLAKRLDAEGLRDRFFYITHVNKDRASVVQAIRSQVESLHTFRFDNIERERNELAEVIEKLESEIDKNHEAVHAVDDITGLSYRILIGQLIDLEEQDIELIDVPALRKFFTDLNQKQISMIEETCSPIARVWLESCFEGSPLQSLKIFSSDKALITEFITILQSFIDKENRRDEIDQGYNVNFDIEDPTPHQGWVDTYDTLFKTLNWSNVSSWFSLFSAGTKSSGAESIKRLTELQSILNLLDYKNLDHQFSSQFIELPISKVKKWATLAKSVMTPISIMNRLNPWRLIKYRRIQKILTNFGETATLERIQQFQNAADLERQQRPIREEIKKILKLFSRGNRLPEPSFINELKRTIDCLMEDLVLAQRGVHAICSCPRQEEIGFIVSDGLPAYQDLVSRYEAAFGRYQVKQNSLDALDKLAPFFNEDLFNACLTNIQNNSSNIAKLLPIIDSLPSLPAYQEFRIQAPTLSPEILVLFATLREKEAELKKYPSEQLDEVIRRLIAREARLGWKDRIEQIFPILRLSQKELIRKIQSLDDANTEMRKLNEKYLASNLNTKKIRSSEEWEDITRLKGPRSRRLREIIERGCDIGLMQLRPVWLMNPETASQLLPLRAGMFDLIIFDEASQIPIENSLPTLYRAKRAVISGDEKQMPPTTVFMKRFDDDEEYATDDEESNDFLSETERDVLQDTWNRREIKDCSDLLTLGKMVLPKSMLQIHYRSKFRELIAFSNAAFYGNNLSVPVRHPESVIQNIRPVEVIRVDGIYENQTNRDEAEKVVDVLARKWMSPNRPSIGVVTFNAKQADLIDDVIEDRADNDPIFRQALSEERERQQKGEDMSFFVKNVENVQGDERDMIIFSSTFGRNEDGAFRKQFGLLGQTSGERRLNVAITRAREKIVLVTSMPINEISDALPKRQRPKTPRDYLQAYFDYVSKINDGSIESAGHALDRMSCENNNLKITTHSDKDGFIRSVSTFIKSLGLIPLAIKENDAFGLDFVIEDPEKKRFGIGIECDAHRHPLLETARAREVWRPKILKMGIPYVHRVTSYAWYHQRKEEMIRLKQVIENALGIVLAKGSVEISLEGQ